MLAGAGLQVTIKEGWAFINGYWYHNDADLSLEVPPNTTSSTITYGVFVQWSNSDRDINIVIQARTSVDRESPLYELKIAEIVLPAGSTQVSDSNIKDTRADESVCGFVKGLIEVVGTADLFEQFEDLFEAWFEHIKDQLDEDAAGHLQIEFDELAAIVNGYDIKYSVPVNGVLYLDDNATVPDGYELTEAPPSMGVEIDDTTPRSFTVYSSQKIAQDYPFKLGIDPETGKYGYYEVGADTVIPFSTGDGGESIVQVTSSQGLDQAISITVTVEPVE